MPRLRPRLAVSRSWTSSSASYLRDRAPEVDRPPGPGHVEAEGAGQLADDDLGDQHLGALSGAAELQHVGAVVVGLDDAGQRPALHAGA